MVQEIFVQRIFVQEGVMSGRACLGFYILIPHPAPQCSYVREGLSGVLCPDTACSSIV